MAFGLGFALFELGIFVLGIVAWCRILNKAGYSAWWVLIALVPLVNVVMFFVFAFSDWPALANAKRSSHYGGGGYDPYGGPGYGPLSPGPGGSPYPLGARGAPDVAGWSQAAAPGPRNPTGW